MNIIKIILEEIDNFDWVREVTPYQAGEHFSEYDICFESNNTCKVNINKDDITFVINWDDWVNWTELGDDNTWYVEPLLYHGPGYDGGGDYYEFDSYEFNYSGNYLTEQQEVRFQDILDTLNEDKKIEDFIGNSIMLDIKNHLKYPPLKDYFDTMVNETLNELGYVVQKNRWLSLSGEFQYATQKTGSSWELYGNVLTIDVTMDKVFDLYSKGVETLSDLLLKVSEPISEIYWSDMFYEDFDTSGADVGEIIDKFLDDVEYFLDDTEGLKWWVKHNTLLNNLGFKPDVWATNKFVRENPNGTSWYVTINYDSEMTDLKLYGRDQSRWSTDPIRSFRIPLEYLQQYVSNYSLKLESVKNWGNFFNKQNLNENIQINKNYVNTFLLDFGYLITLNLSQVTKMGVDSNSTDELNNMMMNLRKPIINGLNYSELIQDTNTLYNKPKLLSEILNKIREFLIYIEPRISKFVEDGEHKTKWLEKIKDLKIRYKNIISK